MSAGNGWESALPLIQDRSWGHQGGGLRPGADN